MGAVMRVLLSRVRIGVREPTYSYRLYVPFREISPERQALIPMHSDYGHSTGLLARVSDVIAPMAHLESAPGVEKHKRGRLIDDVAERVGALLLQVAFPEMREPMVPFRLMIPAAPSNARVFGSIENLSGRYGELAARLPTVTATSLGFRLEGDR